MRVGDLLRLAVIGALSLVSTSCGATPIDVVDPALVGTWQGECRLDLPVVFNPNQIPEGVERSITTAAVSITIFEDATVEGSIAEARFEDCVLKYNRGELGRMLNMATDYIIIDGHLAGQIVSGHDENETKSFTIPFNLVEGRIQGGLMWLQTGKYPYPLCDIDLERRT
jgi:hypothetical protein